MDRKYDLMNNTESENAEDYKVPKQPTELECKGYMEDLKRPPYVKTEKNHIRSQHRHSNYTAAEHRQKKERVGKCCYIREIHLAYMTEWMNRAHMLQKQK